MDQPGRPEVSDAAGSVSGAELGQLLGGVEGAGLRATAGVAVTKLVRELATEFSERRRQSIETVCHRSCGARGRDRSGHSVTTDGRRSWSKPAHDAYAPSSTRGSPDGELEHSQLLQRRLAPMRLASPISCRARSALLAAGRGFPQRPITTAKAVRGMVRATPDALSSLGRTSIDWTRTATGSAASKPPVLEPWPARSTSMPGGASDRQRRGSAHPTRTSPKPPYRLPPRSRCGRTLLVFHLTECAGGPVPVQEGARLGGHSQASSAQLSAGSAVWIAQAILGRWPPGRSVLVP